MQELDINVLFRELVGDILENGLEAELDDELGYSKYDYRNKDTDNSRNGHSTKRMKTSFGEVENLAMYYPTNPQYHAVCVLQGHQSADGRLEACLCGS